MVISMVISMVNDSPPDESQSVATCVGLNHAVTRDWTCVYLLKLCVLSCCVKGVDTCVRAAISKKASCATTPNWVAVGIQVRPTLGARLCSALAIICNACLVALARGCLLRDLNRGSTTALGCMPYQFRFTNFRKYTCNKCLV